MIANNIDVVVQKWTKKSCCTLNQKKEEWNIKTSLDNKFILLKKFNPGMINMMASILFGKGLFFLPNKKIDSTRIFKMAKMFTKII